MNMSYFKKEKIVVFFNFTSKMMTEALLAQKFVIISLASHICIVSKDLDLDGCFEKIYVLFDGLEEILLFVAYT